MNISNLNKAVTTVLSADTRAKNAASQLLVTLAEAMPEQTIDGLQAVKVELYKARDWKVKGQKFGTEAAPKTIQVYFSTFNQAVKLGVELSAYTEINALKEAIKEAKKADAPAVASDAEASEPAESHDPVEAYTNAPEPVEGGEGGLYDVGLPEGRLVVEALPEWFNDMAKLLLAMTPAEQDRIQNAIQDGMKAECIVLGLERQKKMARVA